MPRGMAREPHVQDIYMQLHELQSAPTQPFFYHYDLTHSSEVPVYEVTGGVAAGCAEGAAGCTEGAAGCTESAAGSSEATATDSTSSPEVMMPVQESLLVPKTQPFESDVFMANCNVALQMPHSQTMLTPSSSPTSRKRKLSSVESDVFMANCNVALQMPHSQTMLTPSSSPTSRKRKLSSVGNNSSTCEDDDCDTNGKSSRMTPDKKQNHSEIEKRRRDKMNTYINELSSMIPICGAMARKLDKLTVLRMAVQHLRSVRGTLSAGPLTVRPRPSILSQRELNALILQAAHDCFLLVVGCDRGKLLYASDSVKKTLRYDQAELLGQSFFDILHPKDVAKVKEQLSASDLSPRERLIDIKTMLPVKTDMTPGESRFCPGARRSFFCRIKCKMIPEAEPTVTVKEEAETSAKIHKKSEKKYCVVQFTGYLKSWMPAEMSDSPNANVESNEDGEAESMSCLVAVGRAAPPLQSPLAPEPSLPLRNMQYVSRHATDGKFIYVDQRVTLALGFLPQELNGTSLYEYVTGPELGAVARIHKRALVSRDSLHTPQYSFRRKDGTTVRIQTHFKPLRNPWTKDVECLVANNTVIAVDSAGEQAASQESFDIYKRQADAEMQRLIDSQVESQKIGSAIAEDVMRRPSTDFSPELPPEILQDVIFSDQQTSSIVNSILGVELNQVRQNAPLSSAAGSSPVQSVTRDPSATSPPPGDSPPLPFAIDGNGEAAMAVIMSLLEADAGLGGPVNFAGLPWPLP